MVSSSRGIRARLLWAAVRGFGIGFVLAGSVAAETRRSLSPAESLPPPTGAVILTVRGDIARANGAAEARLDRAMIEAMGLSTMHTGTIWTEGTSEFQGIDLSRLMVHLGADGSVLRLTALNDYAVDIPMSEAVEGGPMLAMHMDGKMLSPRDRGPLWLVYPYDTNPAYKNEVSYSRSIWQLSMIEVLP
ncbi:MAG: molybdopterin-dependent oxidoreductase [Paracoccaceae bacterium]